MNNHLADKILDLLRATDGLSDGAMAMVLGCDRQTVNSILSTELRGNCYKGNDIGWHIKQSEVEQEESTGSSQDVDCEDESLSNIDELEYSTIEQLPEDVDVLSQLPLVELFNHGFVHARVTKVIKSAISDGKIPYQTVSEFLLAGKDAKDKIRKLPSLGYASALEFEALVKCVARSFEVEEITLCELFDIFQPGIRLRNCINHAVMDGALPCDTVGEFLNGGDEIITKFSRLPSMGKKSLEQLCLMVRKVHANLLLKAFDEPKEIHGHLVNILSDREREVLLRRLGDCAKRPETLEEIAKGYSVTRERVRQLEVKAIKICRAKTNIEPFIQYLSLYHEELDRVVMGSRELLLDQQASECEQAVNGIAPYIGLCIKIVFENLTNWVGKNYHQVHDEPSTLCCWVRYGFSIEQEEALIEWLRDNQLANQPWHNLLMEKAYSLSWPLSVRELSSYFPYLNEDDVRSYLVVKRKSQIENGCVIRMGKLSPVNRMIYLLRDAKKALHTSEIRSKHLKMFGEDMAEHAIGSTLGRMSEALIVERGVYDLYENLSLSFIEIVDIADKVFSYVETKGMYVSAKVIYKDLFYADDHYRSQFTDYTILGITQDDDRFSIKRGLMIGLNSKEFEASFVSMNDSIYQIVKEDGPISPIELKKRLFTLTHRDVLSITTNMLLKASDEYVAVDAGVYDLLSRVIGNDAKVQKVQRAIEIALLEKPATAFHLKEKLESVGIDINIYTLCSLCSKFDNIELANHLISLSKPSEDVKKYNEVYTEMFDPSKEPLSNRSAIKSAIQDEDLRAMVSIDSRLSDKVTNQINIGIEEEEDDFLGKLVEEFNF